MGLAVPEVYLHEFICTENGVAWRKLYVGMPEGRVDEKTMKRTTRELLASPQPGPVERGATKMSRAGWL